MKYKVTHKCGHVEEVELFGPDSQRKRIIEDREKHCLCSACADKKNDAQAEAMGWPELTGSEKQIAWAKSLRSDALADFDTTVKKVRNSTSYTAKVEEIDENIEIAREYIFSQTSAKYWIDRRSIGMENMIKEAIKAVKGGKQ